MKSSFENAKKLIVKRNEGYNYYNRILIETTADVKKTKEFFIKLYGINKQILEVMLNENYNKSIEDLFNWIRFRNNLELDPNKNFRFLFNNLIPVESKEEALEKWGCDHDIDVYGKTINESTNFVPSSSSYYPTYTSKEYAYTPRAYIYNLINYCQGNISFKDRTKNTQTSKINDNMSAIEISSSTFKDNQVFYIYKDFFTKKPIGKKFCETLSKLYPEYKITYLMDNVLTEELDYVVYKDGKVINEIKPQGKEGDEFNGPNNPYLKAVSMIDEYCYIICPKCGKIIDNYIVRRNLECPYCDEELNGYKNIKKQIQKTYDEEDY